MDTVHLKAPAKINLTLDITGVRDDGYHTMKMIMQSVDLCDLVRIEKTAQGGIRIECSDPTLPTGEGNIAHRAAAAYFDAVGQSERNILIHLEKRIPHEAGLAGGSADAAAVIVGLNELFRTMLTVPQMCRIGLSVGADVPFCIQGGTALAEGIGELLLPLPGLPKCLILIAKPKAGIKTAESFRKFDQNGSDRYPDTERAMGAIVAGDLEGMAAEMCNVLEEVAQVPEIEHIKQCMLQNGALGSVMTGSGSAVVGVFASKSRAKGCLRLLEEEYEDVFLVEPLGHGAKVVLL